MGDDLVAFLEARLAEMEAAAKAATSGEWHVEATLVVSRGGHTVVPPGAHYAISDADAAHIALHDPARALREVKAIRAHIRMWETFARNFTHVDETVFEFAKREALEGVLARDAEIWADHPDYKTGMEA